MRTPFLVATWLLAVALLLAGAALWALPLQTFQTWAVDRAAPDEYAMFEAYGQAAALVWVGRRLLPVAVAVLATCIWRWDRVASFGARAAIGLLNATHCGTGRLGGARTLTLRALALAWMLLAARHAAIALEQRTREWIYFGLRSGQEVLPNISFQNRDVIRYVQQATPPDARILALSDQKLFFLAYYLLPREVYHPMHPDAEFVIPQANQQRPLAAYRLEDIPAERLARLQPDYILEYFEGAAYVDESQVAEDDAWIRFWRSRQGEEAAPGYLVRLRRYEGKHADESADRKGRP